MENKAVIIDLKNISISFDDQPILKDVSLEIHDGEFVTLLGPSGCGKTTTLRIIAGFLSPDSGDVIFEGKKINGVPAHKRQVNTIFQRYALFPNLNVADNIAFGLKLQKKSKSEIKKIVEEMLSLVNLKGFEKRNVSSLSGGQQQRVAIARALAVKPRVLLLDEPLGALDLKLRKDMQSELKAIQQRLGITFIYVTHDQEEALSMSDTIVVMDGGVIQQIGSPTDIYNEPQNAFVADFIGESNIFNGIMTGKLKVRFCGAEFVCLDDVEIGTKVDAVVRPEDVMITTPEQGAVKGVVTSVVFKGVHYEITVESGRNEIVIQTTKSAKVGDKVGLNVEPDGIHIMISETAINKIESSVNRNYALGVFDGKVSCDLTEIVPGSAMKDGVLVDANGEAIDREKIKVIVSILPEDIDMSDDEEAGIICGHIINLIYKGDHYSYVVRTDNEEDFIVDDEYLWNMEDRVSLIIPEDKMKFSLKK